MPNTYSSTKSTNTPGVSARDPRARSYAQQTIAPRIKTASLPTNYTNKFATPNRGYFGSDHKWHGGFYGAPYTKPAGYRTETVTKTYARDLHSALKLTDEQKELAKWYSDADNFNQINSIVDVLSYAFDPVDNGGDMVRAFKIAGAEWFNRKFIKPIEYKDKRMFIFNNLVGFGETMDILANLVKAVLPTSVTTGKNYDEVDALTRLKRAIGYGVKGRYSYDMDVQLPENWKQSPIVNALADQITKYAKANGNDELVKRTEKAVEGYNKRAAGIVDKVEEPILNFLTEYFVDPINWFTFGTSGLGKGGAKALGKSAVSASADDIARWAVKHADDIDVRYADDLFTAFQFDPDNIVKRMNAIDRSALSVRRDLVKYQNLTRPEAMYALFQADPELTKLLKQEDLLKAYLKGDMDAFDDGFYRYFMNLISDADKESANAYLRALALYNEAPYSVAQIKELGRNTIKYTAESASHRVNIDILKFLRGSMYAHEAAEALDSSVTFIAGAPFIPLVEGAKWLIKKTPIVKYIHNSFIRRAIAKGNAKNGSGILAKGAEEVYNDINKTVEELRTAGVPDDVLDELIRSDRTELFVDSFVQQMDVISSSVLGDNVDLQKIYGDLPTFLEGQKVTSIADYRKTLNDFLDNHPEIRIRLEQRCPGYDEYLDLFSQVEIKQITYQNILKNYTDAQEALKAFSGSHKSVWQTVADTLRSFDLGINIPEKINPKNLMEILRDDLHLDDLDFDTDVTKLNAVFDDVINVLKTKLNYISNLYDTLMSNRVYALYIDDIKELDKAIDRLTLFKANYLGYQKSGISFEPVYIFEDPIKTLKNILKGPVSENKYDDLINFISIYNQTNNAQRGYMLNELFSNALKLERKIESYVSVFDTILHDVKSVQEYTDTVRKLHAPSPIIREEAMRRIAAIEDSRLAHNVRYKENIPLTYGEISELVEENLTSSDREIIQELMYQVSQTDGMETVANLERNFPELYKVLYSEDFTKVEVDIDALNDELDQLARADIESTYHSGYDYIEEVTKVTKVTKVTHQPWHNPYPPLERVKLPDSISASKPSIEDAKKFVRTYTARLEAQLEKELPLKKQMWRNDIVSHPNDYFIYRGDVIPKDPYEAIDPRIRENIDALHYWDERIDKDDSETILTTITTPEGITVDYTGPRTVKADTSPIRPGVSKEQYVSDFQRNFDDFRRAVDSAAERRARLTAEHNNEIALKINARHFQSELVSGEVGQLLRASLDTNGNMANGIGRVFTRLKAEYGLDIPDIKLNETQLNIANALSPIEDLASRMQTEVVWDNYTSRIFSNAQVATAFQEVFQSFREMSYAVVNTDYIKIKIAQNMDMVLSSRNQLQSLSLDNLVRGGGTGLTSGYEDVIKQLYPSGDAYKIIDRLVNYGHADPGSDTIAALAAFAKEAPDHFDDLMQRLKKNNTNAFSIDIECGYEDALMKGTTNKNLGQITQFGITRLNKDGAQETIVIRLTGEKDNYTKLIDGASEIYVDSEADLLQYVENYFKVYDGKIEKILGYNSDAFDIPWIQQRWVKSHSTDLFKDIVSEEQAQTNRTFRNAQMTVFDKYARAGIVSNEHHIDIYNLLKRYNGIPVVEFNDILAIDKALRFWDTSMAGRTMSGINVDNVRTAVRDAKNSLSALQGKGAIEELDEDSYLRPLFGNASDAGSDLMAIREYLEQLEGAYENFRSQMQRLGVSIDPATGEVLGEVRIDDIFNMHPTFTSAQESYYKAFYPNAKSTEDAWHMHELYDAFVYSKMYYYDFINGTMPISKQFRRMLQGEAGMQLYKRLVEVYNQTFENVHKFMSVDSTIFSTAFITQATTVQHLVPVQFKDDLMLLMEYLDHDRVINDILGGRTQITNFTQVWSKLGESSPVNYRVVNRAGMQAEPFNKPGYRDYFRIPEGTTFGTHNNIYYDDVLKNINDVYKSAHKNLDRLKNIDGLFDYVRHTPKGDEPVTGYFKDVNELLYIISAVQERYGLSDIPERELSWISYLDLSKLNSSAECFAMFWEMAQDKTYKSYLRDVLFEHLEARNLILAHVDKDAMLTDMLNDMYHIAFGTRKDVPLLGMSAKDALYSKLHSSWWESLTSEQRLAQMSFYYQTDDIHASAKAISRNRITNDKAGIIYRYQLRNAAGRRDYLNTADAILSRTFDNNKLGILQHIADNPEYALRYLLFESGFVTMNLIQRGIGNEEAVQAYKNLVSIIQGNVPAYERVGIAVTQVDQTIYLTLNKTNTKRPVIDLDEKTGMVRATWRGKTYTGFTQDERIINKLQIPKVFPESGVISNLSREDYEAFNNLIDTATNHNTNYIGTSDILSTDRYTNLFEERVPEQVQSITYTPQDLVEAGFFSNIELYDNHDLSIDAFTQYGYHSSRSALSDLLDATDYSVNTADELTLMVDTLLDRRSGMDLLNAEGHLCYGLTDKECIDLANSNDLIPVVWVPNKSELGGYVDVFKIYNEKSLQQARNLGVTLVPYQLYSKMFGTINMAASSSTGLLKSKLFRGIMFAYKVGYLANVGTWFRNLLDSNLKAMMDTRDPVGIIKNNFEANKLLIDYDNTINLMSSAKGLSTRLSDTQIKKFYTYREYAAYRQGAMKMDDFFFVRGFIENGPSAGESQALIDWIKKVKKAKGIEDDLYAKYVSTGSHFLKPMSFIESRARLAQYLTLVNQGVLKTDAFVRVSHSAFDYNTKSRFTQLMETIIPFYNFQRLNLLYWIEEFEKNPALLRAVDDYWGVAQNMYGTDSEYMASLSSQGTKYHMLAGNLLLDPESGLVLKVNPSAIDAINFIVDPVNKVKESLWAPIGATLNYGQEITGMLSSGMYSGSDILEQYLDNISAVTILESDYVPIASTMLQRLFRYGQLGERNEHGRYKTDLIDSTGTKNYKRLYNSGDTAQAYMAAAFPGVFGSVSRWMFYIDDATYTFKNIVPYWTRPESKGRLQYPETYQERYSGRPQRNYNYYKPAYNNYRGREVLRQIMYKMHRTHKMRYNISKLSTNLVLP